VASLGGRVERGGSALGDNRVKKVRFSGEKTGVSEKKSPGISGKNRGATTTVAAPGVAYPSDATEVR